MILFSFAVPVSFADSNDNISGLTASVYGYALNDYLGAYGVISTQEADSFAINDETAAGENGGIIYADLIDFNNNNMPFLVIYLMDKNSMRYEVHILRYNENTSEADCIGIISKPYNTIPENCNGEFNIGYQNGTSYISYKTYENHILTSSEYYTVIDNDAFMYVTSPAGVSDTGIMDFNCSYFHSGMDLSCYNKTLGGFFKKLKDITADSVTIEDISQRLTLEEEQSLENALSRAVSYCDFDISRFKSMAEYRKAMELLTNSDRFYLISNMYSLGDEIYYVRFSTDRSFYNYALFRRSDSAPDGYQLLKVRTDCIPLSDYELEKIYDTYKRSTLLMKKARNNLKLSKAERNSAPLIKLQLPKLNIEKKISVNLRTPLALIGGGTALVILVAIWVILLNISSDDE